MSRSNRKNKRETRGDYDRDRGQLMICFSDNRRITCDIHWIIVPRGRCQSMGEYILIK